MKASVPPPITHPSGDKHLKLLDATIKRHQYQQDTLIEILHRPSELFGYLELNLLLYIAHHLKLPASRVYRVVTFYNLFSLAPKGKHNCVVYRGTACYVKGSQAILSSLENVTKIRAGETTSDGEIS
jgi:bidirectional [NiFe] hydrogenase diaphorase subunit